MATLAMQSAKRRQAVGVAMVLVGLTVATSLAYHLLNSDAVAFRRGERAYARGDYSKAIEHYEAARAAGRHSRTLDRHLAESLLAAGRPAEALTLFLQCLRAEPRSAHLRAFAAGAAQALNRPEAGISFYAALGPKETLPASDLVRLADLYLQAGRDSEAIACVRLALAKAPSSADLQTLAGLYLARAGDRAQALACFATALQLAVDHRAARLALARTLTWEKRYPEAIDAYRAYLGDTP